MALKITVRMGGDSGATVVDYTNQIPLWEVSESGPHSSLIDAGMMFGNGSASQYQFSIIDDLGEIPRAAFTKNLPGFTQVTVSENGPGYEAWLSRGRISDKGISRGDHPWADSRTFRVTVNDGNQDLKDLALVAPWARGAETGRARVLALIAAFLNGSPRLTTVISNHLVAAGGEVSMPAKTYAAGTELATILDDCAQVEGKLYGVVIHHQASASHLCFSYRDEEDHSWLSTLSITDSSPNLTTSFPPIWDQGDAAVENADDAPISHIVSTYGASESTYVVASDATRVTSYDYRARPHNDSLSVTVGQATSRAAAILNSRRTEHVTHQVSIQIPATKADLLCAGMSITIRSAASMGGQYLGTTQTRRISQLKWEPIAPDVGVIDGFYLAHMQLDRPIKVLPEKVGLPVGPKAPTAPTAGGSVRFYHSAHGAGSGSTAESLASPNLSVANIAAGWEYNNGGAFDYFQLYSTAANTVNALAAWDAVDALAGQALVRGYVKVMNDSLLAIIQAGGTVRMQAKARARYGTGISEPSQQHTSAWAVRVYRPSTGLFVGTPVALSLGGSSNFPAQATDTNRLWSATLTAVPGALITDYIVVDIGADHTAPTSGGTGASVRFIDTAATDLPEDESSTGALNSWIEFAGTGTAGDSPGATVLPGNESFGTDTSCYAPCGHTHAQGKLAPDGIHYLDASGIQYDGTLSGLTATDVQQAIDAVAAGGNAAWFNVTTYGALGDGTTDDTAAINDAIAALNTAGLGILYFPAGDYKVTAALTTITASGIVRGDGSMSFDGLTYGSRVTLTSGSVNLFSTSAKLLKFEDIGLLSNSGAAPTAGAGVYATSAYLEQKTDFSNVHSRGFYDCFDIAVGAQWSMDNVLVTAPVRYGIRIRNTVNNDAGDWSIVNSNIYADAYNSTSGIRIESSGGGKITNTKINMALSGHKFTHGIDMNVSGTTQTVILLVANNSIENVTGDAIRATAATGTSFWRFLSITGNQVGLYGNNTGKAVSLVSTDAGDISDIYIGGNVFHTNGTARSSVQITNVDNVTFAGNVLSDNFTTLYTNSGSTNVTELGGVSDHGGLTGLADDDHANYLNAARHTATDHAGIPGVGGGGGHYETIISGSGPPVALTNEAADDWLVGWVAD